MKTKAQQTNLNRRWAAPAAALVLVLGVGGAWNLLANGQRAHSETAPAASVAIARPSEEALTTIPVALRQSASDKQVALWASKARKTPQSSDAWVNLGDAFMQKSRETFDLGYYGRAEAAYQKALDVSPNKAAAMVGLSWVNSGRHEFEQSIQWANKALAIEPRNNEAVGLVGDANTEMGNYDEAFQQYQKMLDLRPDISSYSRGAHLLHLTGDTRKATWLMLKALKSGGPYAENTAWCRAQLALILYSEGAYVPAEQVLAEGLKHSPHNYSLLAAMGRVKTARKDYSSAISCYRQATEIAPQLDAVVALGDLYAATGRKEEARKQYDLVESIHQLYKSNGVRGDMQIAQYYADHDTRLPEALRMAEDEYKTRKNVYAADTLAWCYYKNGRIPEARQTIETALSRKTPEALFLFHKGMIYAKAGERSQAQLALYQCMSQNAHFNPLFERIAIQTNQELGSRTPPSALASGVPGR